LHPAGLDSLSSFCPPICWMICQCAGCGTSPVLSPYLLLALYPALMEQACIKGYSTQGRLEPSRRNYTALWESLRSHRKAHGAAALQGFKLVAVGQRSPDFVLPGEGGPGVGSGGTGHTGDTNVCCASRRPLPGVYHHG
jgi:hypothetical protein